MTREITSRLAELVAWTMPGEKTAQVLNKISGRYLVYPTWDDFLNYLADNFTVQGAADFLFNCCENDSFNKVYELKDSGVIYVERAEKGPRSYYILPRDISYSIERINIEKALQSILDNGTEDEQRKIIDTIYQCLHD